MTLLVHVVLTAFFLGTGKLNLESNGISGTLPSELGSIETLGRFLEQSKLLSSNQSYPYMLLLLPERPRAPEYRQPESRALEFSAMVLSSNKHW